MGHPPAHLIEHFRGRLDRLRDHLRAELDPEQRFLHPSLAWWFTESENTGDTEDTRRQRQEWFKTFAEATEEKRPKAEHPAAMFAAAFNLVDPRAPHPTTMAEALAIIDDGADRLVEATALELQQSAELLIPDDNARTAVLAHPPVLDGWPWEHTPAGMVLHAILAQIPHTEGGGLLLGELPGKAASADVAEWARDAVNGMFADYPDIPDDVRLGDALVRRSSVAGFSNLGSYLCGWIYLDNWPGPWLPLRGMALLYLAWQAVRLGIPASPTVGLVSVETAPARLVTSMVGADARELSGNAEIWTDEAEPTRLIFEWHDGEQLELDYAGPDANPLVRIAARYGIAAVRDLLGLYLFTWAARAPAGDSLWWWPDEHLALTGLAQGKDGRRRLRTWLSRMKQTRLKVHYATGNPLSGPVVTESATDGSAYRLHLHPALYRGVANEEGRPGKYWWPVSVNLLRLPADRSAGKVHVLAVVLGQQWRGELRKTPDAPPVARINVARLAEKLAIRPQGGRNLERRAADTLRATLDAGKEGGLVGDYRVERGSLDALSGVLVVTPGEEAMRIREEGVIPKAAWLPATGGDVAEWLRRMALTKAAAGDRLGIPGPTLRRVCSTHRNRPLPPKVRAAFRRALWPGID